MLLSLRALLGHLDIANGSDHSFAVDPATAPVFLRPPKLPYVRSEFTTGQNHATLLHVSLLPLVRVEAVFIFRVRLCEEALACDALGHFFLLIVTIRLATVMAYLQYVEPGKVG